MTLPWPPSPLHSSGASSTELDFLRSQVSPLTSPSSSSSLPLCPSPLPSSHTPPISSLSPNDGREKPGGKRKYKSRHLDSNKELLRSREKKTERQRRRRAREEGRRRERQTRDERSPSIEIVYEGRSCRRARRCRRREPGSSPIIITLDSDSSCQDASPPVKDDGGADGDGSGSGASSSPVSSQQTVDFSDLPPLPLPLPLHPTQSSTTFTSDSQFPVHILDQQSNGLQLLGRASPVHALALHKSDDSDGDVDVENMGDTNSVLEWDEEGRSMRVMDSTVDLDSGLSDQNLVRSSAALQRQGPDVSPSDRRLLASLLSDLTGSTARSSPSSQQQEVVLPPSHLVDGGSEPRPPSLNHLQDQGQDFDQLKVPPVEELKELSGESRGERGELPPLHQASPVPLYNRNTPPPLKHKDSGSPQLRVPEEPSDLHQAVNSQTDLGSDPGCAHGDQVIPPISTLKKHFLASGHMSRTSCLPEPAESHPAAAPLGSIFSIHSSGHKSH